MAKRLKAMKPRSLPRSSGASTPLAAGNSIPSLEPSPLAREGMAFYKGGAASGVGRMEKAREYRKK